MIKLYAFAVGVIVSALAVYRFIVPVLMSQKDDLALLAAGVIALIYPVALAISTKKVWKQK